MSEAALRIVDVHRQFRQGKTNVDVLRGASAEIAPGEVVALVGPSGSGKSTLLQIAGLLERPDRGDVIIGGTSTRGLGDDARTRLRREALGFIYQNHHLLPEFSALENIVLPQMISGRARGAAAERARARLASLGLGERAAHRPSQLSGGEQQRVAIGRALANDPRILLADEPTGSLDQATAESVFELLLAQVRSEGLALLLATHNLDLAARTDRVLRVEGGVLVAGYIG
ncbi:MAG: ABC transporter ATP-binding protein [Acetobacterales bacterium]